MQNPVLYIPRFQRYNADVQNIMGFWSPPQDSQCQMRFAILKSIYNMVFCALLGVDIENRELLRLLLKHSPIGTVHNVEQCMRSIEAADRYEALQRQSLLPEQYKERLIDAYLDELFSEGFSEREERRRFIRQLLSIVDEMPPQRPSIAMHYLCLQLISLHRRRGRP